jgi:hypothetical protein
MTAQNLRFSIDDLKTLHVKRLAVAENQIPDQLE